LVLVLDKVVYMSARKQTFTIRENDYYYKVP